MGSPYRENAIPRFKWLAPSARRDRIILASVAAVFVSGVTVQCLRGDVDRKEGTEITTAEVMAVVATNKVDLRERCFSGRQGVAAATVTVDVQIDAKGGVSHVSSTGTNDAVSRCVENEVKQWHFPAHPAPTSRPVRLPFVFERT